MNPINFPLPQIQSRIFSIRGMQVMIDRDLADMYQVETRVLNQAVKRNMKRFPSSFMFKLKKEEFDTLNNTILKSQIVISKEIRGGRRKMPFAFTEQGVSMLSGLLKSDTAIDISIQIMNAFVEMRKFISANAILFQRLDNVELKQIETDHKFEQLFEALEDKSLKPKQGIFYDGQIYDAYTFVSDLIRSAKRSIVLMDNCVDDTVLTMLSKRKKNILVTIYTRKISKQLTLDLQKHNAQYAVIKIHAFTNAHDRFLIIDDTSIYHIGASLKDLGKKWFAFSKMDLAAVEMLSKLKD